MADKSGLLLVNEISATKTFFRKEKWISLDGLIIRYSGRCL